MNQIACPDCGEIVKAMPRTPLTLEYHVWQHAIDRHGAKISNEQEHLGYLLLEIWKLRSGIGAGSGAGPTTAP